MVCFFCNLKLCYSLSRNFGCMVQISTKGNTHSFKKTYATVIRYMWFGLCFPFVKGHLTLECFSPSGSQINFHFKELYEDKSCFPLNYISRYRHHTVSRYSTIEDKRFGCKEAWKVDSITRNVTSLTWGEHSRQFPENQKHSELVFTNLNAPNDKYVNKVSY